MLVFLLLLPSKIDVHGCRCVLSAVIGMLTVVWYSLGGHISEEEMEEEVRQNLQAKENKGRFFGLLGRRS